MKSAPNLFKRKKESFVLVNTLSYSYRGIVIVPDDYKGYNITSDKGHTYPTQMLNGQIIINVQLKPFSFTTFKKDKKVADFSSTFRWFC